MDEELWRDPRDFRPERFLDENNRVIRDNKILAFGAGKILKSEYC
jgi:cytochrome P450